MVRKLLSILIVAFATTAVGVSYIVAQRTDDLAWQDKYFHLEEFSLSTPFGFDYSGYEDDDAARMYHGSANGIYLYAFSDSLKKREYFKGISRFVTEASEKTLDLPSKSGESVKIEFIDRFGYYNRIWTFRTDNRLYSFQTTSTTKDNRIADRFFLSIEFRKLGVTSPFQPSDGNGLKGADQDVKPPVADKLDINPVPKTGSGIGAGNGPGNSNQNASSPSKMVGLKIVSKPKAVYTDFARFYRIEGTVMVRVTFMANGSIGSVVSVSTLPFGLTDAAFDAAKRLKFEPAILNGVSVTSTKTFIYTFSIY